jgi:HEAT repeat protein
VRVALLAELERRKLVPGPPQWVRLLRETQGADQIAVVRAAAAHPSDPVTQELIALLASQEALLVSAAAISLGVPGNEKAVAPLGKLLGSGEERVRNSAIRGLGRIGTPSAQSVLAKTAESHSDPATRRRARAEVARRP